MSPRARWGKGEHGQRQMRARALVMDFRVVSDKNPYPEWVGEREREPAKLHNFTLKREWPYWVAREILLCDRRRCVQSPRLHPPVDADLIRPSSLFLSRYIAT